MWQILSSVQALEAAMADPTCATKVQFIFKHSTSCGISSMAKSRIETFARNAPGEIDWYLVDVIRDRSLSLHIASLFNIVHESPQLIHFRDGKAMAHTSHNGISQQWLTDRLTHSGV